MRESVREQKVDAGPSRRRQARSGVPAQASPVPDLGQTAVLAHAARLPEALARAAQPGGRALRVQFTQALQRTHGNQAVMRMVQAANGAILQRKCAPCAAGQDLCAECAAEERLTLQRRAAHEAEPAAVPASVHEVLGSPGQPLDSAIRGFMESRFGHDFGPVRLHTDVRAAESAQAVNALAYTVGQHIVFGAGQYAPGTSTGQRLLAHELTHVVQQGGGNTTYQEKLAITAPDHASEREADDIARLITARPVGRVVPARTIDPRLQRTCGPALGAPTPDCTRKTDDPTNISEIFEFRVNCDELTPAAAARVPSFLSGLATGTTLKVHGYASMDGPPTFNWNLSCHRANKMASVLRATPPAFPITDIFKHGPVPGPVSIRRAVWVEIIAPPTPTPPTPTPTPPAAPPGCTTPTNPDLSGTTFNPTTDGENVVALKNPLDAFDALGCRDDAFAAATASGLAGPHLGPQDAFRHCVWSCCMAQEMGASDAEKFGTGHENSNPSSIPFDNQMDLHNNAIGRGLGTPGADCEAECRSALTAGRLRTIRGPHTRPPAVPPVPTSCIGASDQPWP